MVTLPHRPLPPSSSQLWAAGAHENAPPLAPIPVMLRCFEWVPWKLQCVSFTYQNAQEYTIITSHSEKTQVDYPPSPSQCERCHWRARPALAGC